MAKTTKRRIDVMISSTTKDLQEHRKQVNDAILRLKMTPLAMEFDEAITGKNALSYSLDLVDEAEIYVGIFGVRYGFIPKDSKRNPDEVSITELEYRRAKERGIPILIFMMDMDKHFVPANFIADETATQRKKLEKLKNELTSNYIVSFFSSTTELRAQVYQALAGHKQKMKEEEGDDDDDPSSPDEKPPLPAPPEFYADPPYRLAADFFGRADELRRLDAWATSADPMMIVEAIGGMGKSALTWEWVKHHAHKHHFDGIMWWSFYESGATMSGFVRHALAYVTRQHPDALNGNTLTENFKQLRHALHGKRYLFVLDGLERVLVAYHRWNAAQMRDDTVEDAESIIKDRDIRACTDPKDDEILRTLIDCTKTLISSRLTPAALEDKTSNLQKGVARIHLNGLHPDDALALVRHAGVTVENVPQFHLFMRSIGYHSLMVKLIAGMVMKLHHARGDFDVWYDLRGRDLHISDIDIKQSQTHILQFAFDGLDATQTRFLAQIAAFGDAVTYDTMSVFNPFVKNNPISVSEPQPSSIEISILELQIMIEDEVEKKEKLRQQLEEAKANAVIDKESDEWKVYQAYLDEKDAYLKSSEYRKALSQFDELLTELEERGVLRWDREKDTYDMHPVVRGYAFDKLENDLKTPTYDRIRGHFEAQNTDNVENPTEVAHLQNTIAIYNALVGAGKWDEAAEFYTNRLRDQLHYSIAAYYKVIELLTPLFPGGINAPPRLNSLSNQSSITTTLAGMYRYIGRTEDALVLKGLKLKIDLEDDNISSFIIGLRNYSISLLDDNQLALAVHVLETALELSQIINEKYHIIMSNVFLLGVYKHIGQWNQADAAYAFLSENPPNIFWQSVFERWYAEILIHCGRDVTTVLDHAEQLSYRADNAMGIRQIKGLRGEVALAAGQHDDAIRWFEEAVSDARKHGSSELASYLGKLAKLNALRGNHEKAYELIEATLVLPRGDILDIDVSIAETHYVLGDYDKAKDYALKAFESACGDGAPYIWWWELERAKVVLDKLGVAHPPVPEFNPETLGKFPYEDEIRAVIERERAKRA